MRSICGCAGVSEGFWSDGGCNSCEGGEDRGACETRKVHRDNKRGESDVSGTDDQGTVDDGSGENDQSHRDLGGREGEHGRGIGGIGDGCKGGGCL